MRENPTRIRIQNYDSNVRARDKEIAQNIFFVIKSGLCFLFFTIMITQPVILYPFLLLLKNMVIGLTYGLSSMLKTPAGIFLTTLLQVIPQVITIMTCSILLIPFCMDIIQMALQSLFPSDKYVYTNFYHCKNVTNAISYVLGDLKNPEVVTYRQPRHLATRIQPNRVTAEQLPTNRLINGIDAPNNTRLNQAQTRSDPLLVLGATHIYRASINNT